MNNKIKIACITSLLFSLSLSFIYMHQIINYTKETYLIQNYQKERGSLSEEAKALSYVSSTPLSLAQVEEVATSRNFTKSEEVNYIEVMGREVVVR